MRIRRQQEKDFFRDHEKTLLSIAITRNWGAKGFELKGWAERLLPDGYRYPEEETYAELLNALQYLQGEE